MFIHRALRILMTALVVFAVGCDRRSPTAPTAPSGPTAVLSVTSVTPIAGSANATAEVRIIGTGFNPGATATFDGRPAITVTVVSSILIVATAPSHAEGTIDIVVTNPGGQSARLASAFSYVQAAVTSISPDAGITGRWVRVLGFGFLPAARITFDGTEASRVIRESTSSILALVPPHGAGAVDVSVINPGSGGVTLARAFTYQVVTLTANSTSVPVGGQLTASWIAPAGQSAYDWIGLYRQGDPNTTELWYAYTNGAATGTVTIAAPGQPGQYEFRYLVDDGYDDAARSGPVTVVPAAAENPGGRSLLMRVK